MLPSALALLLLFRLLIPSGYMIAPDHSGGPGLIPCAAPAQPAADPAIHSGHEGHPADHAPPVPNGPGPDERPCAYAALAAPPLPPEAPLLARRSVSEALPPDLPAGPDLPRLAPASSPPPARGPPLSV